MLMMSDLERIRGRSLPPIPLRMRLRACLPDWLGGLPLYRQVCDGKLFDDPRDELEYLYVALLRNSLRPDAGRHVAALIQLCRQLRWQLRVQGVRPEDHFRPGVEDALEREFKRVGRLYGVEPCQIFWYRRLGTKYRPGGLVLNNLEVFMRDDENFDLDIALQKIHEWSLEDGDLGFAYWFRVGKLLQEAAGMQSQINILSKELERCRAGKKR